MIEYPKIETLYDRKDDFSVDATKLRVPAFGNVKTWHITEKIDGTNVRIGYDGMTDSVSFGGRTDNAQMPTFLSEYLRKTFTPEHFKRAFEGDTSQLVVTVFSEGYGAKIQKGGGLYRADCAVRVFDVLVNDWWLSPENVEDVATKLGVAFVPRLCLTYELPKTEDDLRYWLGDGLSRIAIADSGQQREAEGIVARSYPALYLDHGKRCMWKLKFSDFRKGKK